MTDNSSPTIVFADDGTEPSTIGWRWIANQPWPQWRLDVMTAEETDIVWGEEATAEAWEPEWQDERSGFAGESVRFLKAHTDPRAMLSERTDADLMVVGKRLSSYLEALLSGSTAEWLLYHPPAPLVVAAVDSPVRKVTICADGSSHSLAAVATFDSLPLAEGTEVTVLTVADGRLDPERASAETVSALAGPTNVSTVTVAGPPTVAILDHLAADTPDLVVLGTRGLTGWRRLALGSTAAAVVRTAQSTCLVASSDGNDD